MQLLKIAAQKIIELFGYELRRKAEILGNSRSGFPSEPFEAQYQLMKIFSRDVVNIFDIGAYKGQTAKEYRSKFPTANIYCFEPFPDSIVELRKRFAEDQHIHIIPKAVAQQDGKAIFHVNELDATNSLLPRPVSGRRYYPKSAGPKATIEVEVICLDSFVRETRISQIDILKLDIQGGELSAFRGAEMLLRTGNIPLIFTEIMFIPHYAGAPLFHEIWSYLSHFGYSLFDIYELHRAENGQLRYGDAIFLSEAMRSRIDTCGEEP